MGAAISLYETEVEAQPEFNRSVPTGAVGTLNSRDSDRSSSTSKDSKAAAHQSSTANPRLSPHAGPGTLLPVDAVAGIVAAHGGARNGIGRRSKLKAGHALMHALPDLQPIEAKSGDPLPGARHIVLISTVLTTDAAGPVDIGFVTGTRQQGGRQHKGIFLMKDVAGGHDDVVTAIYSGMPGHGLPTEHPELFVALRRSAVKLPRPLDAGDGTWVWIVPIGPMPAGLRTLPYSQMACNAARLGLQAPLCAAVHFTYLLAGHSLDSLSFRVSEGYDPGRDPDTLTDFLRGARVSSAIQLELRIQTASERAASSRRPAGRGANAAGTGSEYSGKARTIRRQGAGIV